ncbi:MAG: hypothetical protein EHM61_22320 [Acidobacteria bacterium]|nr:MAG: hypothetical protein EHM61_22320 [Acidobacteriota bacterium]
MRLGAASVLPRLSTRPLRTSKPNMVLFLIDDLGWRDLGFMGSRYYETRRIDCLAGEGMIFSDAYANAPVCAPTRACLLSGQYGPRHGVYTVWKSDRKPDNKRKLIPVPNKEHLDPGNVTFMELLRSSGYVGACIGKWHLGADPDKGPIGQGFDLNVGGNASGAPPSYFSPYRNPQLPDGPPGEYLTDRLTDEAIRFIAENRSKPFFLYFTHYAVHEPIQAKEEVVAHFSGKDPDGGQKNPRYAAMIKSVDDSVGRVLDKLRELGLEDDTIIIFTSDNGGHGTVTSNAPLRGSKGMLYEGGIREPMIVRWPGRVKAGSRCSTPVMTIDLYPTFLELAGIAKPQDKVLDGLSLLPLLTGTGRFRRDAVFWHFPAYLQRYAGMEGYWRTTPAGAIRKGDWKLIEFFEPLGEENRLELYNLHEDIGESRNLVKARPDKAKELLHDLQDWRQAVNAPVPTERNPKYDPNAEPDGFDWS